MAEYVGQAEASQAGSSASATAADTQTLIGNWGSQEQHDTQRFGAETTTHQMTPAEVLLARALAKARYHEDREDFLGKVTRWLNFAVLISGTAAFAALTDGIDKDLGKGIAFGTAFIGAVQLVFDFPGLMRTHMALRRVAIEICAEAVMPTADIEALNNRLIRASVDEPPTYHAVEALAYNAAQCALDRPNDTLLHVPRWDRFWKNVWRFSGGYKTPDEIAEEKALKQAEKAKRKRGGNATL